MGWTDSRQDIAPAAMRANYAADRRLNHVMPPVYVSKIAGVSAGSASSYSVASPLRQAGHQIVDAQPLDKRLSSCLTGGKDSSRKEVKESCAGQPGIRYGIFHGKICRNDYVVHATCSTNTDGPILIMN